MTHLKISPEDSKKLWISSDFHFHHSNLVTATTKWQYTDICRDYNSLEEHDEDLIQRINKYVKWDDTLIFDGDWSFGGFDKIEELFWRLECHNIHFILGNHDQHIESNREDIQHLFISIQDRLHLEIGGKNFIIQHVPCETWEGIFKGWMHLFGHQHSDRVGPGRKMDIGIDKAGKLREPYSIDEILSILESVEITGGIGDSDIEVETRIKRLK